MYRSSPSVAVPLTSIVWEICDAIAQKNQFWFPKEPFSERFLKEPFSLSVKNFLIIRRTFFHRKDNKEPLSLIVISIHVIKGFLFLISPEFIFVLPFNVIILCIYYYCNLCVISIFIYQTKCFYK